MTKQYFVRKRYDTLHYSTVSERYNTLHVLYCTNAAPGAERRLVPAKSNLKPQTPCDMAVTSAPQAMPPQHPWDPKQRVHISRWHCKREDAHMCSFSMFVGYFLTLVSCVVALSPLTAALHVVDLTLWSFALQLWVLIWVDFIKAYLFGNIELHQAAAGASRGINNTIQSKHSTVKACLNVLSASDYPAVPSPTTTTLPVTHPATSSPTTTSPMAEGLSFAGMPYPTYGVTPAATVPPMATAVSEAVASSSTHTGVPEPMPRRYEDGYHRPTAAAYITGIHGFAALEPGYTMPAPGFTSLSGLLSPESCGVRSRGSGRSSNRSLTRSRYVRLFDEPLLK